MNNKVLLGVALTLGILGWVLVGWVASASQIAYECRLLGQFYVGTTVYDCEPQRQPLTKPITKPIGTP